MRKIIIDRMEYMVGGNKRVSEILLGKGIKHSFGIISDVLEIQQDHTIEIDLTTCDILIFIH